MSFFPTGGQGNQDLKIWSTVAGLEDFVSLSRNRENNPKTSARAVSTGDDFHRIPHHQWQRKAQDSGVLDYRSPPSSKRPRKSALFRGFFDILFN